MKILLDGLIVKVFYEGLNVCVSRGTPAGDSVSKNGSCYVHTVSKGET